MARAGIALVLELLTGDARARGELLGEGPVKVIETAAGRVARAQHGRWSALKVAGRVALNRTDVVRDGHLAVAQDEHHAKLARVVGDLRAAAQDAQHVLER